MNLIDKFYSFKESILVQKVDIFPFFEIIYFPGNNKAIELVIAGITNAII